MTRLPLTSKKFHAAVDASPILVVEFTSENAGAATHQLAERFPAIRFEYLDPTRETDVARMFGLAAPPGTLIFRDRVVLYCEATAPSAGRLASLLEAVMALDMDIVRLDLAKERSEIALHMQRMCPTARRGH